MDFKIGYWVKSKKFKVTLNKSQQDQIFDIWMNPSEELKKDNFAMRLLPDYFRQENCKIIFF